MQQLYFKHFGILSHHRFRFSVPSFWSGCTPGVSHPPLGVNVPAQLNTARCFEGSFIPSLLLAQETKEVQLEAASVEFSVLWINTKGAYSQRKRGGKHMRRNNLLIRQFKQPLSLLLAGTLLPARAEISFGEKPLKSSPPTAFILQYLCLYYIWAQSTKVLSFVTSSQAVHTACGIAVVLTGAHSRKLAGHKR